MLAGPAWAGEPGNGFDCGAYTGTQQALPRADAEFLESASAVFKNRDRKGLLAISDRKLLLVRRWAFGVDARGGNLWIALKPSEIGKDLELHIPAMTLPSYLGNGMVRQPPQDLPEFKHFKLKVDGSGIAMGRKVCAGYDQCDVVPLLANIENLLGGLMQCTSYSKSTFIFTDGILVSGLEYDRNLQLQNGVAWFFSNTPNGYKLSALISLQ